MSDPDPPLIVVPEPAGVLAAVIECLCAELESSMGGGVCWCGIWHDAESPMDVCSSCDSENRCGMAWVRMAQVYPFETFPEPAIDQRCARSLAYQIEVGVARCWPTPEDGAFPDPDEAAGTTLIIMDDMMAMRRALRCCAEDYEIWLGTYDPFNSGGCAGGTWTAFVAGE